MKRISYYIIFAIMLFSLNAINAQGRQTGSISGIVKNMEDGLPIAGATIRIDGTSIGQISNRNGLFHFKSIPVGKYTLLVSFVGYEAAKINIEITPNETISKEIMIRYRTLVADEIVVTANKRVQMVQEVPISMSILSGKMFQDKSISRLDRALQYVQGVEVNNDNVSIRGSSGFAFGVGSRAILLLDGFPLLSGDNGDIKSDAIPLSLISQVEIVKGAGSALYGASALGGVINIITKEPNEKPYLTVNTQYGIYTKPKYDSWQYSSAPHTIEGVNLSYTQKFGNLGLSFAGNYTNDEGHRKYSDEQRYMLYGKANYSLTSFTNIILSGLAAVNDRADWVYWGSLDSATRPPANTDLNNRLVSEKYNLFSEVRHIFSDKNFLVAKTGFYTTKMENKLQGAEYRQSTSVTWNSEVQYNTKLAEYFHLTSGVNYVNNNVSAEIYGDRQQHTLSIYSQMESPLGDLVFTYGGRIDYEHTEGIQKDFFDGSFEVSPKLAMSYKTMYQSVIRASIGRGFRPASVAERFASVAFQGFRVIPNEDLKHERSWSFEIGFNQPILFWKRPVIIDFAFYNNELFDLIEPKFVQGTSPSIQFVNTTRARITGAELNLKTMLLPDKFGVETGISVMLPKDIDSNKTLKYRSTFSFLARAFYRFHQFEIFADYRFRSKFERVDDELKLQIRNHDARVAFNILDIGASYDFAGLAPLVLSINVHNILDYYYTEVPGNLGRTRTLIMQLGYKL